MLHAAMPPALELDVEKTVVQDYWEVLLRKDGIVWLVRRQVPFPSIPELHRSYDDFLAIVDDWLLDHRIKSGLLGTKARSPLAWLFDVRGAPDLRNDAEFEEAIQERRRELLKRSPALAILVKSSAGHMQLKRITREEHVQLGVFSEPDEAVMWLRERIRDSFPPRS